MKRMNAILAASSLLAFSGSAFAVAQGAHDIDTSTTFTAEPAYDIQHALVGSDTLQKVMDNLITSMTGSGLLSGTGYFLYRGIGSSAGERFLMGGVTNQAGEPECFPTDANGGVEGNPGCEEIAPMSRQMGNAICDDDHDNTAGAGGWTGVNTTAEGMAVCKDGIVLVTDNVSLGQYGNDPAGAAPNCGTYTGTPTDNTGNAFPNRGVGNLNDTGSIALTSPPSTYTIGAGYAAENKWKDVVRLVYTGCDNASGTCAGANNRVARCGSELRTKLLADWHNIIQGSDCGAPGNNCPNGLRLALRRDDASGTTGAFLEIIGIANSTSTSSSGNLKSRATIVSGILGDTITAMPSNGSFCDGGHQEGWYPTNVVSGVAKFDLGDPIRKNCAPEDDLCAYDGKMPVVRSIRSTFTPVSADPTSGFPKYQCTLGAFSRKPYIDAPALPVCPDGTRPNLSGCKFPYYDNAGVKEFDCMNQKDSLPLTAPAGTDGRSYNIVMHQSDGTVRMQNAATGSEALPHVASWRLNMVAMTDAFPLGIFGGAYAAGDFKCRETDATRNIGCLVGQTTCSIGYAGREAANSTANNFDDFNEPLKLFDATPNDTSIDNGGYGFARSLYINAIHGFENLTEDCLGRGGSAAHCLDQKRIADEFYATTPTSRTGLICQGAGYIPKAQMECVGAFGEAGCGAPTTQAKTECLPDDPAAAP